jgi:hypothetical protein
MALNYGIKISQNGYSPFTAEDKNLILKTNFSILKVATSGITTFTGSTGGYISHNLGYLPQFLAFIGDGTTMSLTPAYYPIGRHAWVDSTKLYFKYTGSASTFTVFYYIFYEGVA